MARPLTALLSRNRTLVFGTASLLLLIGLLVGGCDLREVIEVERPYYEEPPPEAQGFLGYDEADEKLTVCGNCHVGEQAQWAGTNHADAWATLQESGHAADYCENCHTVGPLGNPFEGEVGYAAVHDERYHDVQCESCHGAGGPHVANPGASQPIASLAVGDLSDPTDLSNVQGCGECHQGSHHPFVEEWAQSKHATVVESAAGREPCASCHRGQGALEAWGIEATYREQDDPGHLPITCGVCHDPHGSSNNAQLRLPIETTSIEEHLCAQCHNRRTIPDPGSSHGLEPHAPEAALLLGDAGWFPPGANIDQGQIIATHGSDANAKLCATCHVNSFPVEDQLTGEFIFNATGHLFVAIPCVDEQGVPIPDRTCNLTQDERSFDGCLGSGCHASEGGAAEFLRRATSRIQQRADELIALLLQVDQGLEEAGGEIDPAEPTFTVAEGALFNYHLATFGDDVVGASTHNPYLIEALLVASIEAVQTTYDLPSINPAVDYKDELQRVLDAAPTGLTPAFGTSRARDLLPTHSGR